MKKIIIIILSFLILPKTINASVVVMDSDSNRVLYGSGEYQEKLIASTTKIMTALVVINNADLSEIVTVTPTVLKSYGSGIYIEVGEEISIEDLLYGLLLRSGNDAALMLAEKVGGSEEGFVALMNEMATSLGMKNTKFINASGLENNLGVGNTSTAYDMALLMSYAIKNETFKTITSTEKKVVKTNFKTYEWYNKNKLLNDYKYTTGGKTGYTKKARRTLVTSATKDSKNLVIVTLNEQDDFNLHKSLYEKYFKTYKRVKVLNKKTFLKSENKYIENDLYMLVKNNEINDIKIEITETNDISERVGYVSVSLNGKTYFKENIYKSKGKKKSFLSRIKEKLTLKNLIIW